MKMGREMRKMTWTLNDWLSAGLDFSELPRDLTPDVNDDVDVCSHVLTGPDGCGGHDIYWCTRLNGHTGRHAAGNGVDIVAVWS